MLVASYFKEFELKGVTYYLFLLQEEGLRENYSASGFCNLAKVYQIEFYLHFPLRQLIAKQKCWIVIYGVLFNLMV